jgi:hypothetical protein
MTPQEEAISLVQKYVDLFKKSDTCFGDCKNTVACQHSWYQCEEWYRHAIECALINVDELIKATTPLTSTYYWQEVKQEIEKL